MNKSDQIEKTVDIQSESNIDSIISKQNVYQKIHGVMMDAPIIVKEEKKVNGQYRFASHDAVASNIKKLLVKWRLIAIPTITDHTYDVNYHLTILKISVKFINIDKSDEVVETCSYGYGLDNQDKGLGKAYSYAFKYALLKTFCLETGDDDVELDTKNDIKLYKSDDFKPAFIKPSDKQVQELHNLFQETETDPGTISEFMKGQNAKNLDEISEPVVKAAINRLLAKKARMNSSDKKGE